ETPKETKEPKETQKEPKEARKDPKEARKEPKEARKEPKEAHKEPKEAHKEFKKARKESKEAPKEPNETGNRPKETGKEPKPAKAKEGRQEDAKDSKRKAADESKGVSWKHARVLDKAANPGPAAKPVLRVRSKSAPRDEPAGSVAGSSSGTRTPSRLHDKKEKNKKDKKEGPSPPVPASKKEPSAKNLEPIFDAEASDDENQADLDVDEMLAMMETSDSEGESSEETPEEEEQEDEEMKDESQGEDSGEEISIREESSAGSSEDSSTSSEEEEEDEEWEDADAASKTPASEIDRKKFPVSLASHLQRDKTDLFNLWLDNNQATKARDIIKKYGETKGLKLIKALKGKGRYYYDDEFPDDEEEIFYYTHAPRQIMNDNSTSSKLKIEGKEANPDTALVASLTGEEGPLHAGAMPGMKIESGEGEKELALALSNGGSVGKIKPPKKTRTESAEKVLLTTSKERAEAMLDDILKDSGAARKLALGLEHVHYGDRLKQELMNFSSQMEGLYRKLQSLILKKVTKAKKYNPILIEVEAKNAWYKSAE
ncbi:unnamed protein product, partial [Symbiodinium necroappetens]